MSKQVSDLVQGLKDYFENTPTEQLEKELEDMEKYNEIGPDVLEYFEHLKLEREQRVIDVMCDEVPILEDSTLTEADVRKVIGLFHESSDYFNKKIDDERGENGGSQLAIDLLDGRIDGKELAVQYVLHRLNIKND